MNNVEVKVKEIIIQVLNVESPIDELKCNDLIEYYGINSVDALEILIHIENEFDIEIDEEHLNAELINNIASVVKYIENTIK